MKLVMIRHGQTEWNTMRRVQGRTDTELNECGVLQAKAAARALADETIAAVYSSHLKRALSTAQHIAKAAGIDDVVLMEGLCEIDFGSWEGKTNAELERDFPVHWGNWNWVLDEALCREIGAESAQAILSRSLDCIDKIQRDNPENATVVLVSHSMPIKLLTAHFIGLPLARIPDIRVDNCASSVLQLRKDGGATLMKWNDTSYLGGLL